ncbi:MAG: ABC transporter permease [Brevibacterium yomogidense]|uniref:ABC transporter permease n=1 Tax=Brevibacterium sp. Mu109 TaxID=1255669 RepID=UPI000C6AC6EE|nr:ABC transporter permease [Brevibacterium sp. Mu109]SMX83779.1 peptide/nickel transport system permease protein [Brevibacterium sp. Mu109]
MIRTAMRVLGRVVGGLVAVSLLVHVLVALLPGDAASVIAGPAADPEAVDDLRAQMGLDRPAPVAWWEWASSALVGDLGTSLMTGRPVIDTLSARVANSFLIALPAWVISVVVGTWIAGIAALGRPRWVSAVTVAVCGIPEAVVVIGLVILLGVWLHVLPAISLVPLGESPLSDPRVLVLPIIALAVPSAAWMARMLRGPAADVARRPDVRDAQDRGRGLHSTLLAFAVPALAPTIVQVAALLAASTLAGAVVVEELLAYPGVGAMLAAAVSARDLPVVMGTSIVIAGVTSLLLACGDELTRAARSRSGAYA